MLKNSSLEAQRVARIAKVLEKRAADVAGIRAERENLSLFREQIMAGTISLGGKSFPEWAKELVLPLIGPKDHDLHSAEHYYSFRYCIECEEVLDDETKGCADCDQSMHPECHEEDEYCYRCRRVPAGGTFLSNHRKK